MVLLLLFHSALQEDINNVLDWANKWQLKFQPDDSMSTKKEDELQ